jgi:glutamate carboxypeptidase
MEKNIYFEKIDELYDKYLQVWKDVSDIESPAEYKKGVDECGDYFVKMAEGFGFKVEKLSQSLSGDPVVITFNPDAAGKPITFSGHIDTVYPVGTFTKPTYTDDEKIYGPGVCDCKGGIVATMMAMEALQKCGFDARPVQLSLQVDEEICSRNSKKATINWILERAKDSAAFINVEPTLGTMCIERKGGATYKFKIHGVEAHASMCAERGSNAIIEAAHKMIELEKFKDKDGLTCSCNVISGGTVANTVAGYCEFLCNVRFLTREEDEFINNKVEELKNTVFVEGCVTEVERLSYRYSMPLTERNINLANNINNAFEKYGLARREIKRGKGGSDAADSTVFGLPTVDSLGVKGEHIHSPNEFAYLDALKKCAKQAVAMILEIY